VTIRVLLCDDHPVVRSGYRRLLEQAGDIAVVHEAGDGEAAYAAWIAHRPDVLVTDLSMPGGGGLALIRRVRGRDARARILVFTMHDSALLVRRAFDEGALGFVTKASDPQVLIDAVQALHAGRRFLAPELPPTWLERHPDDADARIASLSAREFEVFRLIAAGCSAAQCAERLNLSTKTVANHQSAIKEKLGVATSAALAHLAIRHGVIEPASP
jgi:DNA-binding NarL/FixJ family response regulator